MDLSVRSEMPGYALELRSERAFELVVASRRVERPAKAVLVLFVR